MRMSRISYGRISVTRTLGQLGFAFRHIGKKIHIDLKANTIHDKANTKQGGGRMDSANQTNRFST